MELVIERVKKYFDSYLNEEIDIQGLLYSLSIEISNLEKDEYREGLLKLEAIIDSIQFTVSSKSQRSEVEKEYDDFIDKVTS